MLGPTVISGEDFNSATAVIDRQSARDVANGPSRFELDGDGADRFADATTAAVGAPEPTDQIAIIVDRVVISSPDGPVRRSPVGSA